MHLGTVLRRLAYTAFALHGCLESHVQVRIANLHMLYWGVQRWGPWRCSFSVQIISG